MASLWLSAALSCAVVVFCGGVVVVVDEGAVVVVDGVVVVGTDVAEVVAVDGESEAPPFGR
ncbi:hypothetical protein GS496_19065 [Rhodococcus hoagii]|nr:hypothetical protein [Prescottella equi]